MNEHEHQDSVKIKKSTMWKVGAIILAVLFLISIFTDWFSVGSSGSNNVVAPTAGQGQQQAPVIDTKALLDDDPVKGDSKAPITVIEFSDFQCPFCERFYTQTLPQIEENYIKTGKVKLVYRDFPLTSLHPMAQKTAEAAECADDQGKFWEYHNKIFENQAALSIDSLKKWAADLGLDTGEFNSCLDSGKMASEVNKDLQEGSNAGVQGTPSFIINGQMVSGAQPYSVFQQVFDSLL